jgi:hypothetical protein
MRPPRGGVTALPDDDLKRVMQLVYQGKLPCPFARSDLLVRGMNRVAEEGNLLIGLDEPGLRAVIAAVLAERRPR